jgi:starch synthase
MRSILVFSLILAFFPLFSPASPLGRKPRILIVSPEQRGVLQTGGLAHATSGLVEALNQAGYSADMLMPLYSETELEESPVPTTARFKGFRVLKHPHQRHVTYFLKHQPKPDEPDFFHNPSANKPKKYYSTVEREGEAFAAFDKAAAEFILHGFYDLVILCDWTTGLIPVFLQEAKAKGYPIPKTIFALHNIAYQGVFPKSLVDDIGLPEKYFTPDGYEWWGKVNFLKAGMMFSDIVQTVSMQYAKEVTTSLYAHGFEGVMRKLMREYRLTGILNGIDNPEWDPANPPNHHWPRFSADDMKGKEIGKRMLQEYYNLPRRPAVPIISLTSRLAEQKGFTYLFDALEELVKIEDVQIIIAGDGEPHFLRTAKYLQSTYPKKVRYAPHSKVQEQFILRFSDFFLNAAWTEPSGLNQLFSMRAGTVPIISRVGGLKTSIRDGVTGFHFSIPPGPDGEAYNTTAAKHEVIKGVRSALTVYRRKPDVFKSIQLAAMNEDHSWESRVASDFAALIEFVMRNGPIILAGIGIGKEVQSPPELLNSLDLISGPCENLLHIELRR